MNKPKTHRHLYRIEHSTPRDRGDHYHYSVDQMKEPHSAYQQKMHGGEIDNHHISSGKPTRITNSRASNGSNERDQLFTGQAQPNQDSPEKSPIDLFALNHGNVE